MKLTASLEQNQNLSQNQNLQQAEYTNLAHEVQQNIGNQLDALPDTDRIAIKSAIIQAVADLGGSSSTINFIEYNKDSGIVSYRINDFLEGALDAQKTLAIRDMQRDRTDDGVLPIFKETINLTNLRDQIEQKIGDLLNPFSTDYHSALKDALTTGCFGRTKSIDSHIDNIVLRPDNGFLEAKVDQNYYVSVDPNEVIRRHLAKNNAISSPNSLEQANPQVSTLASVQDALNAINQTLTELNPLMTITGEGPEKFSEHAYLQQAQEQQALEQPLSVTVEAGDTVERIARRVATERYGENATQQDVLRVTAQMIEANGFTNQAQLNRLQIGQTLIIPTENATSSEGMQIYGQNIAHHQARIQAEQARQAAAEQQARIHAEQARQAELVHETSSPSTWGATIEQGWSTTKDFLGISWDIAWEAGKQAFNPLNNVKIAAAVTEGLLSSPYNLGVKISSGLQGIGSFTYSMVSGDSFDQSMENAANTVRRAQTARWEVSDNYKEVTQPITNLVSPAVQLYQEKASAYFDGYPEARLLHDGSWEFLGDMLSFNGLRTTVAIPVNRGNIGDIMLEVSKPSSIAQGFTQSSIEEAAKKN